jgi:hypothetical protein
MRGVNMQEEHIIELLDARSLSDLKASELSAINEHTANCSRCSQAFYASQISNLLLRSRAELNIEPAPFFETIVMAAIRRDEQVQVGPFSFFRIWREANHLIYSMAALALILGLLTLSQSAANNANMRLSTMDPLLIVYGTDSTLDELSYGQVLLDLYAPPSQKESDEKNRQEK